MGPAGSITGSVRSLTGPVGYSGVGLRLFWRCSEGFPRVFQGMFRECSMGVSRAYRKGSRGILQVLGGCYGDVSRMNMDDSG